MSVILDALKKMDATRTGGFEENNVQELYKTQAHSFISHYKYWILAGAFILLMMLTGTLFFLQQKIASLPTAPIVIGHADEKKVPQPSAMEASAEVHDKIIEPAKPVEFPEHQNPSLPETKVVQSTASNLEAAAVKLDSESEPKPAAPAPDPDVNQQASEQVQAVIQNDPSIPSSAAENEEMNVEKNGISVDTPVTTGVDNSIQVSEAGPSEEALHQLKDNLTALMSRQNYTQVIEDANPALSTYPKDVDLHYYLGLAYFNLNRYSEALNILVRLQPPMAHYPEYYAVLANIYMHQEALDNALYLYESLVGLYPDNGSYALGLGIIYQKQGKFAAAKATYQRILSFEPVYWGAYPFVQAQLKTLSSVKE